MRIAALVLLLGLFAGLGLVLGAFPFLFQPWYFLFVFLACQASVALAYPCCLGFRSLKVFFTNEARSAEDYTRFARLHASARSAAVAAGVAGGLIGVLATLAGGVPPTVASFGQALAAPVFGIWLGIFFHQPISHWFAEKAH